MEHELAVVKAMASIYKLAPDLTMEEQEIITHHLRLVWATGYDEGTKQTKHGKSVIQFKDGKQIQIFPDITSAAKSIGVDKSAISKCVNGRTEYCQGFKWKLLTEGSL